MASIFEKLSSLALRPSCSKPSSPLWWPTCCCCPSSSCVELIANGTSQGETHEYSNSGKNGTHSFPEKFPLKPGEPADSTAKSLKKLPWMRSKRRARENRPNC